MTETGVTDAEIEQLEQEVTAAKKKLAAARLQRAPEPVRDYELLGPGGQMIRLSELFAGKDDLILIHNMGTWCVYCTMWADGFNSLLPHLSDRAGFVVFSPEPPETQQRFAESRGWKFPMVSGHGSPFNEDMGFLRKDMNWPGASAFKKDADGNIYRTGKTTFCPGDDYCSVWHFFGLLEGGKKGWEPKYGY